MSRIRHLTPTAVGSLAAIALVGCGGGDDSSFTSVAVQSGHQYAIFQAYTGRDCGDFASESALHLVDLAAPGKVERLPYRGCETIGEWRISPDGRRVVYVDGNAAAFVVDLVSGESTTAPPLHETGYDWWFAPDGAALYFVDDDGDLRRYDFAARSAGPALNLPGTEVRDLRLSPDGRWLAYGTWDEQIALIDLQSGNSVTQVIAPEGRENPTLPAFTADSSQLIFAGCATTLRCRYTIAGVDLYYSVAVTAPASPVQLSVALAPGTTFDYPNAHVGGFWREDPRGETSLDGTLLGYRLESNPVGFIFEYGSADLAFVEVANPGVQQLAPKGGHSHADIYALSPDGSQGIYRVQTRAAADGVTVLDSALWAFARGALAAASEIHHGEDRGEYAFSPDSSRVAWVGREPGSSLQLWSARTDRSLPPVRLTDGAGGAGSPSSAFAPQYTPGGGELVFISSCCDAGLWKVAADGGTPVRLDNGATDTPDVFRLFRRP